MIHIDGLEERPNLEVNLDQTSIEVEYAGESGLDFDSVITGHPALDAIVFSWPRSSLI